MQHTLGSFENIRILVAGDVMLDRYWWGDVTRISPEAPVPVVRLQGSTVAPGGAANVAANISGLGAMPVLLGAIGSDSESLELERSLTERGIAPSHLLRLPDRSTIVKTRIVAHGQQIVRVDREDKLILTDDEERQIVGGLDSILDAVDLIVISDYGKGFLSENVLQELISRGRALNKAVVVDPKGRDYSKYRDATLITPNRREAAQATGTDEDADDMVSTAGRILKEVNGITNVLITEGENGMTVFMEEGESFHLPATSVETYDVTGAGDTVIATLAVTLASGLGLKEAAVIANAAAGEVVQHVGTTAITREMLFNSLGRTQ